MLNITEVRIKKINKGDLLAAASICIDDCFIIREFRQDFSYPLNNETRMQILEAISEQYDDTVEE